MEMTDRRIWIDSIAAVVFCRAPHPKIYTSRKFQIILITYCMKVKNNPRAIMPAINRHQNTLMIVDIIFTRLRLSILLTHMIERIKPATAQTILTPAQAVLTPSGSVSLRNTGITSFLFFQILLQQPRLPIQRPVPQPTGRETVKMPLC